MNLASDCDHRHWRVFPMFLKIWIAGLTLGAGTVGDQEILRLQDQKRMMPNIRRIGDALVAAPCTHRHFDDGAPSTRRAGLHAAFRP